MVLAIGKLTCDLSTMLWHIQKAEIQTSLFPRNILIRAYSVDIPSIESTLSNTFRPPFEKGSTLKRKNLLPWGSKFFPFRADHFLESPWCAGKQTGSHKSVSLVKMV